MACNFERGLRNITCEPGSDNLNTYGAETGGSEEFKADYIKRHVLPPHQRKQECQVGIQFCPMTAAMLYGVETMYRHRARPTPLAVIVKNMAADITFPKCGNLGSKGRCGSSCLEPQHLEYEAGLQGQPHSETSSIN